jgi:hypothetical protein
MPEGGLDTIMMYRRDWAKPFVVDVEWPKTPRATEVEVFCKWDDANQVPALLEALQYTPDWVAMTKMEQGLVRGYKSYSV